MENNPVRYVCIVPIGEGRARAWTMFQGDKQARPVNRPHRPPYPGGILIAEVSMFQRNLRNLWPDALFVDKATMLRLQSPCSRCQTVISKFGKVLCDECDTQLKAMINEEWNSDQMALFTEFTVPAFMRGEL